MLNVVATSISPDSFRSYLLSLLFALAFLKCPEADKMIFIYLSSFTARVFCTGIDVHNLAAGKTFYCIKVSDPL